MMEAKVVSFCTCQL